MQYQLTWETRQTVRMASEDAAILLAACTRLPAAPRAPSIDEMNRAAQGKSPSGLYVSQTLGTVRP